MKKVITISMVMFAAAAAAIAAEPKVTGKLDGQVLAAGTNKLLIFDKDGKTLWSHKAGLVHDVWMLPNGNILFADGEAKEINPKTNKIVWTYKAAFAKGGGVYSCQRLKDGSTMIAENSTGRILEIDQFAELLFEFQVPETKKGDHHNLRMVRKLDNGNYLVCLSGKRLVREYTPEGDVVLEIKAGNIAYHAVRLKNGNTLLGHLNKITEFDKDGKKVWEFHNIKDGKPQGVEISNMTGLHVLENGNIVTGIYSSKRGENGASILEISRDKKIVWRYVGSDAHMLNIQKLSADGKVLKKTVH